MAYLISANEQNGKEYYVILSLCWVHHALSICAEKNHDRVNICVVYIWSTFFCPTLYISVVLSLWVQPVHLTNPDSVLGNCQPEDQANWIGLWVHSSRLLSYCLFNTFTENSITVQIMLFIEYSQVYLYNCASQQFNARLSNHRVKMQCSLSVEVITAA